MEDESQEWGSKKMRGGGMGGIGWRIAVSAVAIPVWMVFILLYAFLWSQDFSDYQNWVVFIVSFLAVFVGVGLTWGSMGMRYRGMM